MQEAVKATEVAIPFVFYDGTSIPGGVCRIKKGDQVWQYLDKARKVGAETGVGGGEKSRREWARIGVDDLMLVRGEIIIPHVSPRHEWSAPHAADLHLALRVLLLYCEQDYRLQWTNLQLFRSTYRSHPLFGRDSTLR